MNDTDAQLTADEARRLLSELTAAILAGEAPRHALARVIGHGDVRYWPLFHRWYNAALPRCGHDARCPGDHYAPCERHKFAAAFAYCEELTKS